MARCRPRERVEGAIDELGDEVARHREEILVGRAPLRRIAHMENVGQISRGVKGQQSCWASAGRAIV